MQLIRAFEEQVRSLFFGGMIPGLVHLCAGQEAVAVGVCSQLRTSDMIASNHRGHGHCLAKGADVRRLMAEIMGRRPGYGLGRGGSLHIFDAVNGNLGTNGIVGGGIPLAVGAAFSAKRNGRGDVAVCFFGDGALNQGLLFEAMNMAAIWRLPVVFVCENNGYGEFTASERRDGWDVIQKRAAPFSIFRPKQLMAWTCSPCAKRLEGLFPGRVRARGRASWFAPPTAMVATMRATNKNTRTLRKSRRGGKKTRSSDWVGSSRMRTS